MVTIWKPLAIRAELMKASELRPGDLFSTAGPDYWAHQAIGAIGEKVYIRTHTPCPHDQTDEAIFRITAVTKDGGTTGLPGSIETTEANACLIAAAPDLLDAVRDLLARFVEFDHAVWSEAEIALRDRARAAIAKAEGR